MQKSLKEVRKATKCIQDASKTQGCKLKKCEKQLNDMIDLIERFIGEI
jgi:hypothetical protein